MPYKIFKSGDSECVHKMMGDAKGEKKHCYSGGDAHSKALAYMRALYAAEGAKKEIGEIDFELKEAGMDEKAIEAVMKWRFQPGRKEGKPVTVAAQVEVNFRLL